MNAMAKKRKGKRKRIQPSVKRNRAIVPSVHRIRYKHSLIPHPSTIPTTKNDWMTPLTVLGAGFGAYQLLKKSEPIAPPPSTNVIDGNSLAIGIPIAGFFAYQYCQWKPENCEWLKKYLPQGKQTTTEKMSNIVESSKNGIQSAMNNVKAKIESADGENIKNKVNSLVKDASTALSNGLEHIKPPLTSRQSSKKITESKKNVSFNDSTKDDDSKKETEQQKSNNDARKDGNSEPETIIDSSQAAAANSDSTKQLSDKMENAKNEKSAIQSVGIENDEKSVPDSENPVNSSSQKRNSKFSRMWNSFKSPKKNQQSDKQTVPPNIIDTPKSRTKTSLFNRNNSK